jgi:hypothetical protein
MWGRIKEEEAQIVGKTRERSSQYPETGSAGIAS